MTRMSSRLWVLLLAVVPLLAAAPAGADGATPLKAYTGHNISDYSASASQLDGSCPDSGDSGTVSQDFHQLFNATVATADANERLGINVCWFNTSANASDSVDSGRFMLLVKDGSFAGNVTGRFSSSGGASFYEFKLTITSAVGSVDGWAGHHFVFWACGTSGKHAGLRLHAPGPNAVSCTS